MRAGFKKINAFLTVVDTGSFEEAARQLYITPSAVSLRLSSLEDEMGEKLVVRRRPCIPTAKGKIFYQHALELRNVKTQLERAFAQ
ncbi:LysR family transcriptional regulator (chromosome initiation inhibitor) [Erwinia toletana]|uniref:LysR family transcriptional regulator (Chromosome initiation inhibitor) n=1 Tax=Winslowiella toletana TaxID=92490 RepID=A0ABS4PAQ4_9GAMM|nr:LysR family transcriptional regulator [Winslowiella toletana]MBP2169725.1 LysR family transcriptional regulator (chromosome initiation inhibitor) [Winslowiella toletana]